MNAKIISHTLAYGCLLALPLTVQNVSAHGYVTSPESRAYLCRQGENSNCGAVVYEPQSLEGEEGFPQAGPPDGQIASAGLVSFSPLNEQHATRWTRHGISGGGIDLSWRFTANHTSEGWRYFITKPDWNPNEALGRDAFELKPFCTVDGRYQRPPMEVTHRCNLPSDRSGHHIILAVWDIGDTSNSFYNVIDVDITNGGDSPGTQEWQEVGAIHPGQDLNPGDQARARVFDSQGENRDLESVITIGAAEDGQKDVWPRSLARQINTQNIGLRAGVQDAQGTIVPAYGRNGIFTRPDSGIERVEITVDRGSVTEPQFTISGVQDSYPIGSGTVSVEFTVVTSGRFDLESAIFDSNNRQVGTYRTQGAHGSYWASIGIDAAREGRHTLVVNLQDANGRSVQQSFTFSLLRDQSDNGDYDYRYPDNINAYQPGTRVLGSDGNIYQCQVWPQSGWCTIKAHQYTPGTGSHWQSAWERVGH